MKKIIKILFVFTFMIASKEILNAEEVKYKWFKYIDNNIHYEYNPEETCQNFEKIDYDNFIYGEYKYSLIKPEEKEGRVITKEVHNLDINRHEINIMQIKKFDMKKELLLTEFEIFDKNGNKINYNIDHFYFENGVGSTISDEDYSNNIVANIYSVLWLKFDKPLNILDATFKLTYLDNGNTFNGLDIYFYIDKDLRVEVFDAYSEIVSTSCNDGICESNIKANEGRVNNLEIDINTNVYKYKDKKYKCYTVGKEYLPGYFDFVQGYTKDESDFIKVDNTSNKELLEIVDKSKEIDLLTDKINSLIDENLNLRLDFNSKLESIIFKLNQNKSDSNIIKVSTDKINDVKEVKETTESTDTFTVICSILIIILIALLIIKDIKRFHDK